MKSYDESKYSFKAKLALQYMLDSLDEANQEVSKYKEAARKDLQIKQYLPYNFHSRTFIFTQTRQSVWGDREEKVDRTASQGVYDSYQFADKVENIDDAMAKDLDIIAKNKLISENNIAVYNNLISLIKNMGIDTRRKDEKSRKQIKPYIDCPFVGELKSKCMTYHSSDIKNSWTYFREGILKQIAAKKAIEDKKEAGALKIEKEKQKNKLFIDLIKKYNLNFTSGMPTNWEMMNAILLQDKYLYLAHYMEKNRSDWSDNHNYAEIGLNGFKVENTVDQDIYNEVQGAIDNWDGDGRIFRNLPTWDYSKVYSLAGKDIMADYSKLIEFVE